MPRRPNTAKRFKDRGHLVQNSKSQGPNAQRSDPRENRFSLLNWFDASTSQLKRPNPSNKANNEPKTSQPTWTKVKNGNGSKNVSPDIACPTQVTQSSPSTTTLPSGSFSDPITTTSIPNTNPTSTQILPPSLLSHPTPEPLPNLHPTHTSAKHSSQRD